MRGALLILPVAAALLLAGCGGGGSNGGGGGALPVLQHTSGSGGGSSPTDLGFPGFATKNTTRVGGADPVTDAAAVALAVFPSQDAASRPAAVALADAGDWRAATAAAALMAPPVRAPLLLSDGGKTPSATSDALGTLKPKGSEAAGGGQVLAVGSTTPDEDGLKTTRISDKAPGPEALAAAVDRFLAAARGKPSDAVLIVSSERADFGVPAAAWAAKSGDPVLFVSHSRLPAATVQALKTHAHPRIYVLGPPSVVSGAVTKRLARLGAVTRIAGRTDVANAIAFARFSDGRFGWGVTDPGHGVVFASVGRPLDGPAAAALASSGTYGPLILLDKPDTLSPDVLGFLLDIQPGYRSDPVRGVYNHGWLIGDGQAISLRVQDQIDHALEISPVNTRK